MRMLKTVTASKFKSTILQWLEEDGELVVMVEGAYGSPYACLFTEYEGIMADLKQSASDDTTWVRRHWAWLVRGIVDEGFLQGVQDCLNDEANEFAFIVEKEEAGKYAWAQANVYHLQNWAENAATMREYWGKQAVFGRFPWYVYGEAVEAQVVTRLPFGEE